MRVALVSESFLPQVNGVTNTVRHVVDRLVATGHQALVVAPGPGPDHYGPTPVVRVRSASLPGYRSFALGLPDRCVGTALDGFRPDVVHLASPVSLGACGLRAARRLGVPTVAVYQTDLAGFARRYGVPVGGLLDAWVGGLHRRADRTLVPSSASRAQLEALGVDDLHLWGRGVELDAVRPSAPQRRRCTTAWAAGPGVGERVVVGYVGRLAAEKNLHRLVEVSRVPGVDVVVVGDGPAEVPAGAVASGGDRSPACCGGRRWRRRSRRWTCSCTPVRTRRSARPCRRRRPAAYPWWRRGPEDRSTWSSTASPGCSTTRRTRARCAGPWRRSWATRCCGARSVARAGRPSRAGRGSHWWTGWSTEHYLPLALPAAPAVPARPRRAA